MSNSKILMFVLAFALVIGIVWMVNRDSQNADEVKITEGQVKQEGSISQTEKSDQERGHSETQNVDVITDEIRSSLNKLQDLMDNDETHKEALQFAKSMLKKEDVQKMAAINAFEWIGGRDSKSALITLLPLNNEVSSRAQQVLISLFERDAQSFADNSTGKSAEDEGFVGEDKDEEVVNFDVDLWREAFMLANTIERNCYLVTLISLPNEVSIPVLMDLMDSTDKESRELAFEYFESTAEGTEVNSRAEAQAWFDEYLARPNR